MDKFFKVSERGSTVSTEIIGGLTTFLAMSYIIAVNPAMMQVAGIPFGAALTSTCFGAAIMTVAMGFIANRPVALASGMGINAVVAYGMCVGMGVDWRTAMAVVFLEGLVILALVICGVRESVMKAIPVDLQRAIGIGIGLFIALMGLEHGGIIVPDESTYLTLGNLTSPVAVVALVSIAIAVICTVLKLKVGLLVSIIGATIIAVPLGVSSLPTDLSFSLDFSAFAAPFQETSAGPMGIIQVFLQPALIMVAFSLVMSDFFDTMGSVMAVASKAEFCNEDGTVKDMKPILVVDSVAASVGGFVGASSITSYVESTAGASVGARTGLASIVTGVAFALCAFLAPLVGMVSTAATCGALVVVGFLMMGDIGRIDWGNIGQAFPVFATLIGIPLTYSISDGIGFGFITYCIIQIVQGKARDLKPLMWIVSVAFLAMFLFT